MRIWWNKISDIPKFFSASFGDDMNNYLNLNSVLLDHNNKLMHFDLSWLDYKTQIGIVYFIPIIIAGVVKNRNMV